MIEGVIDQSVWQPYLTSQGLRSSMWLYAYESVRNGTSPIANRAFIEGDPFFSLLLNRNISFFDPTQGFSSIKSTLRFRRAENVRANILRQDFSEDFDIDTLDFYGDEAIDEPDADFEDAY